MSYNINDIIIIEWGIHFVAAVNEIGFLSPSQILKVEEIVSILDSLPVITDDDRLDALKIALEEIRDR